MPHQRPGPAGLSEIRVGSPTLQTPIPDPATVEKGGGKSLALGVRTPGEEHEGAI